MANRILLPKYTSKDAPILIATMLPMAIVMNAILFGGSYFTSAFKLLAITATTFTFLALAFVLYGMVAISLRERFPNEDDLFKRLIISISIFALMSIISISLLLRGYEFIRFYGYSFSETDFTQCYLTILVTNVFLTFLNEGVSQFEKYKATTKETEALKKEYMQSQLLGLKSQMNPHFLFNSLNTLSSLIQECPDKAEDFLDHMSKVYRYLLRHSEEQLVTLGTELNFIDSYCYLLKARHGEGLQIHEYVTEDQKEYLLPPLTLQMLLENTINQNSISKSQPLVITISAQQETLEIRNSLQPKVTVSETDHALENIDNKFKLLCQKSLNVLHVDGFRKIELPLIPAKMELLA
jgi:sensor histidine kinase YesM